MDRQLDTGDFYRTTLCYSVVYAVVMCLLHSGIVSKRLNVASCKYCHTIAQGLKFSGAKDHGKIRTGSNANGVG